MRSTIRSPQSCLLRALQSPTMTSRETEWGNTAFRPLTCSSISANINSESAYRTKIVTKQSSWPRKQWYSFWLCIARGCLSYKSMYLHTRIPPLGFTVLLLFSGAYPIKYKFSRFSKPIGQQCVGTRKVVLFRASAEKSARTAGPHHFAIWSLGFLEIWSCYVLFDHLRERPRWSEARRPETSSPMVNPTKTCSLK